MRKNMRDGFTLIELLVVIAILAVVLAIAVPSVFKVINTSTKRVFAIDTQQVLEKMLALQLKNVNFDVTEVDAGSLADYGVYSDNYEDVRLGIVNGQLYATIIGKNRWAGLKACGTADNVEIVDATDITSCEHLPGPKYNSLKKVNRPILVQGMTPIKWNGTEWVNTTEDDNDWYNYTSSDKKWANAKTADGSMWVWIPRYVYKISSGWHTSTAGTIDVKFSKGTDDTLGGTVALVNTGNASDSNGTWTSHPAFTFGDIDLTGIWVAKFEATAAEGVANGYTSDGSCPTSEDDVTTKTIKSVSGAVSWRCISINNMFDNARRMETNPIYGWGTSGDGIDTHLMKNTEWGAVAYLSKSLYGKGDEEIWLNTANNYTTGCAGSSALYALANGCEYAYNTNTGVRASSSGTIYGIYDMAGGAWEYQASYTNEGNINGSIITSAANKYKDVYKIGMPNNDTNNYALTVNEKGDAIYETSSSVGAHSWFGDYVEMPYSIYSWFARGGFGGGSYAGIYGSTSTNGSANSKYGYRSVLLVETKL